MTTQYEELKLSDRALGLFKWLAIVGAATFGVGLLFAPQRALSSFLLVSIGLLGMGLGAGVFIALQYVCGAHWAVALRRVPEAMCGILPWAAAGVLFSLIAGRSLYPWISEPATGMKGIILSYPFVLARTLVFLAVWLLLIRAIVRRSKAQDATSDASL